MSSDTNQSRKIGVIGAGNIGRTLGEKWKAAGHSVTYGVRNPEEKQALGAVGTVKEVVEAADVIIFAIPSSGMADTLAQVGSSLDGKIVIDATNNVGGPEMNHLSILQEYAPNASLYRAFSSLGWENFANPVIDGVSLDLFFTGDEGSRPAVAQLIADIGLTPVYLGDNGNAGLVDATTRLWFTLAFSQKMGRRLGFKVLAGE